MRSMREAIYVRRVKDETSTVPDNDDVVICDPVELSKYECEHCSTIFDSKLSQDIHMKSCRSKLKNDLTKAVIQHHVFNEQEKVNMVKIEMAKQHEKEKMAKLQTENEALIKEKANKCLQEQELKAKLIEETEKTVKLQSKKEELERIEKLKASEINPQTQTEKIQPEITQSDLIPTKSQIDKSRLPPKMRIRLNTSNPLSSTVYTSEKSPTAEVVQSNLTISVPLSDKKQIIDKVSETKIITATVIPEKLSIIPERKSAPATPISTPSQTPPPPPPQTTRPIRNRVKKNHKDFIYDLPTIASVTSLNPMKTARRRNTIQEVIGPASKKVALEPPNPPILPTSTVSKFVKSSFRMANLAVDRARAQFKTPPRLKSQNILLGIPTLPRRQSIRNTSSDDLESTLQSMDAELASPPHSGNNSSDNSFVAKVSSDKEFKQYLEKHKLTEPIKKVILVAHDAANNSK